MFDLSSIKYIFQIPIQWFHAVNARLFRAYGGNLVNVREGEDGGLEVAVDQDAFDAAVKEAIPEDDTSAPSSTYDDMIAAGLIPNAACPGGTHNATGGLSSNTSWTRAGTDGVKIYLPTSTWDDTLTTYFAWRLFTFDSTGRLHSIGAETILTKAMSRSNE